MSEAEEEIVLVSNIVGKCNKCGKDIDNAVEGYIIDLKGNIYCLNCYEGE
ncbi:MAG: hypothetical protein QXV23_02155 [Candidatus Bathyarchaeia archaeon]